jgi:hypothetical protein
MPTTRFGTRIVMSTANTNYYRKINFYIILYIFFFYIDIFYDFSYFHTLGTYEVFCLFILYILTDIKPFLN